MFLIFDTETTGLPRNYNAPISDSDNWPRVVQIAWQLHDVYGSLISSNSMIVKPDGFTIPFNAAQVHGITTERATAEGKELSDVLNEFAEVVKQAPYLCGHNISFDLSIVGAELYRLGVPNYLDKKAVIDTKNDAVTDFCALPGGRGGKYKWPTLSELYQKLFNTQFAEAHNAAFDVEATSKAFFELLKRNVLRVTELPLVELQKLNYAAPDLSHLLAHETKLKEQKNKDNAIPDAVAQATTPAASIPFSHLHNHTQFSVLQAVSDIDDLVKRAIANNMPALAITDHGNMYGAFLFWQSIDKKNKAIKEHNVAVEKGEKQEPKKQELKAIIGCELYVCKNHLDKTKQDNGFTQVFLAKNKTGYQNLSKLSSIGFTDGFYYVPRVDKEVLLQHKEGLIATTGSLTGEIPHLILNTGETQAEEAFVWWKEHFGEDFYVELNNHFLPEEKVVNETLLRFSKKYEVPYFAANSNYYPDKKNAAAHDVLLCIKDGTLKETPIGRGRGYRYGFPNDEFYFKSPAEMQQIFAHIPQALENTNLIVDKIESFKLGRDVLLPKFQIPEDFKDKRDEDPNDEGKGMRGENAYLKYLTYKGAEKRYPNLTTEIQDRLDFELSVMQKMGFPGYFLIVQDFTTAAREMGVSVGPGRGSAAGSAVAYCLGITNIDPIKYDLLFERFLNPDRISMPDIDIDFDDIGRAKVIDYVINKYGNNQVAQIITYGTLGGKSAIRDTARVLNLPLSDAGLLAKSYPDNPASSLKALLAPGEIDKKYLEEIKDRREIVEQARYFRKIAEEKSAQSEVLKQAYDLEGCVRNTGTHACGIIITPDEMSKFVPITKAKDSNMLVTQFDNSVAENAGLLKMDFLGLRTLSVIKDAAAHVKARYQIELDMDAISLEDEKTLALFQRGETNGIFQFESPGMQKHLKDLKPDSFTDLIAMNALYRPGPLAYIPNYINRKNGKEAIVYDLDGMDEFLEETYGITVYQEQVMRLSQKLAGFSKGDADVLRKAMGKKQKEVLDKMKNKFIEGCAANGYDAKTCEKVWTDWEAFASYAFNKSHSTCYAYLAFQTAYLKAHYPSEFMASTLTHNMGNIDSVTFFMDECKRMNIKVLGPDINESIGSFSVNAQGDIRFGLEAIKGVGSNVVAGIITDRNENKGYNSVFDLARRLDTKAINKKSIEALSMAGAFDSFEGMTRSMFFVPDKDGQTLTDKLIKYGKIFNNGVESNQASLFGEESDVSINEPVLPKVEPWGQLEQLLKEKEVVGFYISGHPLDQYKMVIQRFVKNSLSEFKEINATMMNKELTVAGIVSKVQHKTAKNGNPYGSFSLEDYMDSYEFTLFGKNYLEYRSYMIEGMHLFMKIRIVDKYNKPGEYEPKIQQIELLPEKKETAFTCLQLKMSVFDVSPAFIENIESLIGGYPGSCLIEFFVEDRTNSVSVKMYSKTKKVAITDELILALNHFPNIEYELK
ncbi:MAG: DNA polymerase III subunit alpha [Bacteroidetes bacterium]|nr:DNA polymerase III subunit alpha [Bacteroidota bacterium]